jgi:hypothetical protein
MTKDEFKSRFVAAIAEARRLTAEAYHVDLAPDDEINLHGAGVSGAAMSIEEAVERLYLGDQWFFKIIDVAVMRVQGTRTIEFVRASNHTPCEIDETWNRGEGIAPFKAVLGVLKDREPPTSVMR